MENTSRARKKVALLNTGMETNILWLGMKIMNVCLKRSMIFKPKRKTKKAKEVINSEEKKCQKQ